MSGGKDIVIDFGAITDDNVEQVRHLVFNFVAILYVMRLARLFSDIILVHATSPFLFLRNPYQIPIL